MPRPKPEPEDEKIRPTVSLPRKVIEMAERYLALHPEEDLRDFSALVSRALIAYAAQKHPDLLAECIRKIRESKVGFVAKPKPEIHSGQKPVTATVPRGKRKSA